jgi:hypothetical protein
MTAREQLITRLRELTRASFAVADAIKVAIPLGSAIRLKVDGVFMDGVVEGVNSEEVIIRSLRNQQLYWRTIAVVLQNNPDLGAFNLPTVVTN